MKRLRFSTAGFTLVELLVATALTGVLIVVIMSFMVQTLVQTTVDSARADLLRQSQQALDDIGRTVRLSSNALETPMITDDNAPNAGWQSSSSVAILAASVTDSDNNVLFSDPLNYISAVNNIIYFVDSGTLYKRTLAADISGNSVTTTCPETQAASGCPRDSRLVDNVELLAITYHDNQDRIVQPLQARSVKMEIALKTHKFGQDITSTYTSRMVFRNE